MKLDNRRDDDVQILDIIIIITFFVKLTAPTAVPPQLIHTVVPQEKVEAEHRTIFPTASLAVVLQLQPNVYVWKIIRKLFPFSPKIRTYLSMCTQRA